MKSFLESDSAFANIVNVAEGSDEGVTKNPWWWESTAAHVEESQGTVSATKLQLKSRKTES